MDANLGGEVIKQLVPEAKQFEFNHSESERFCANRKKVKNIPREHRSLYLR